MGGQGQRFARGRGRGWRDGHRAQGARDGLHVAYPQGRTLADLRRGEEAVIASIADDRARARAMRFGMGEGSVVSCITALPGGPIVVRCGRQEIAVGRGLARRIGVEDAPGHRTDVRGADRTEQPDTTREESTA